MINLMQSRRRIFQTILGLLVMGSVFGTVSLASAQTAPAYDPSGSKGLVQCGNTSSNPCTVDDVFNTIVIATNILIGLVGIIAMVSIVWAGFSMVAAAGKAESIKAAKSRLTYSILGLVLVLAAFLIINLVLSQVFKVNTPILKSPGSYITQ